MSSSDPPRWLPHMARSTRTSWKYDSGDLPSTARIDHTVVCPGAQCLPGITNVGSRQGRLQRFRHLNPMAGTTRKPRPTRTGSVAGRVRAISARPRPRRAGPATTLRSNTACALQVPYSARPRGVIRERAAAGPPQAPPRFVGCRHATIAHGMRPEPPCGGLARKRSAFR